MDPHKYEFAWMPEHDRRSRARKKSYGGSMSEPIPLYVCESHYLVKVSQGKVVDYVAPLNVEGLHCYFKGCHSRVFRRILAGEGTEQTKKVFVYGNHVVEEEL